jgi:hypothetical protein
MDDSKKARFSAASLNCEAWFPQINRIWMTFPDEAAVFLGDYFPSEIAPPELASAIRRPDCHWSEIESFQWQHLVDEIGVLLSHFVAHAQILTEYRGEFEFLFQKSLPVESDPRWHFSGQYGKSWSSATFAVIDETERLLKQMIGIFDPFCDFETQDGFNRAISKLTSRKPNKSQLDQLKNFVGEFWAQWDVSRTGSSFQGRIADERAELFRLMESSGKDLKEIVDSAKGVRKRPSAEGHVSKDSAADEGCQVKPGVPASIRSDDIIPRSMSPEEASKRMFEIFESDEDCMGWSERKWMSHLNCSKHAISGRSRTGKYLNHFWKTRQNGIELKKQSLKKAYETDELPEFEMK